MSVTNWEDACRVQTARIAELERENAELNATLDTIISADERAVKLWRAAHPGNELVIPDRAKLVGWLLEQNATLRAHAERVGQANDRLVVETDALRAELDLWKDGNIIREEDRKELIALRADKARLDWMQEMNLTVLHHAGNVFGRGVKVPSTRQAIDAAMKEGK